MTKVTLRLVFLFCAASTVHAQGTEAEAEVREIAEKTGLNLSCEESESFIWALAINKAQAQNLIKVGESALKVFMESAQVKSWEELWGPASGGTKKALMIILANEPQYKKALNFYEEKYKPYKGFAEQAGRVLYWPQPNPRVCSLMHLKPTTLDGMKNVVAHEVGHLCALRFKFHRNFVPAWFEEGVACWLEAKVVGKSNCFCFSGGYGDSATRVDKITDIEWPKWKIAVSGMAKKKADKALRQIIPMSMTELSADEMSKAWSLIDYMVKQDPAKFANFMVLMKRYWPAKIVFEHTDEKFKAQETAIKEAFGVELDELDQKWREWVIANYK